MWQHGINPIQIWKVPSSLALQPLYNWCILLRVVLYNYWLFIEYDVISTGKYQHWLNSQQLFYYITNEHIQWENPEPVNFRNFHWAENSSQPMKHHFLGFGLRMNNPYVNLNRMHQLFCYITIFSYLAAVTKVMLTGPWPKPGYLLYDYI